MGWMWLWWLLPLLIVAALVYVASGRGSGRTRARDILDERLAKGEIDEATYRKLRDELENGA